MSNDLAALANQLPAEIRANVANEIADNISRLGSTGGKDVVRVGQDKKFEMPDGTKVDSFEAHIVEYAYRNEYYTTAFNRNNPTPPVCFAINPAEDALVPSGNGTEIQSEDCATCQQNQFGSSPTSKGKACKNNVVLALLPTDEAVSDHDIWVLKVSPTAIKHFNKYAKTLAQNNAPLSAARTRIFCDPETSWASVRFEFIDFIPDHYPVLVDRKSEAALRLAEEPDMSPTPSAD